MDETAPVLGRDAIVGRDVELGRLGPVVSTIGRGGLVVVEGEPGIGKSRLLAELGRTAREAGNRVLRGTADELDPAPLGLWMGPARALGLPRLTADDTVPPDELRWEALDLLAGALADDVATVVLLDDLHWADDASLWVLERLLGDLADHPVVVIAGSRPAPDARAERWAAVRRRGDVLPLPGLDGEAVATLASAAGSVVDPEALRERTGGNPLLLREMLAQADGAPLPVAVADVLRASIERGGPEEARTLTVLGLAGAPLPLPVLAAAVATDGATVEAHLASARSRDVLRDGEAGPWFRHALLAEAATARVDSRARGQAHEALARAWAAAGDDLRTRTTVARHRLLAVPVVEATSAVAEARSVAGELADARNGAAAAALLDLAVATVRTHLPGDDALLAWLHLERAEALFALDDLAVAPLAAETARDLAAATDDVVLQARAEVAAVTHHNPFAPDPVLLARLADLDTALEAADEPDLVLRARIRGRRAIMAVSFPDRIGEAATLGDEAVDLARRSGHPDRIIDALSDRHFVASTPADLEARTAAAEEVIDLAARAGRPELALLGHEWRFAGRVRVGDGPGALAAIADLEAMSHLMPSPRWRFTSALRRSALMAHLGDRDGALAVVDRAMADAHATPHIEGVGLELGARLSVAVLYGVTPEGVEPLQQEMIASMGEAPIAFIQVRLALGELALGDREAARRRLAPWVERPDAALRGPEGLTTLAVLALVVDQLGLARAAAGIATALRPFAGMLPAVNGVGLVEAVDAHLSGMALLEGDVEEAARRASAAIAFSRRAGSPPLEALALARLAEARDRAGDGAAARSARDAAEEVASGIGLVLPPVSGGAATERAVAPARSDGRAALHRSEGRWAVASPHGDGAVPDSLGMGQLAQLLATPGTEVAAVDLAGASAADAVPLASDLGAALDARAKREYRERITELRAEIDEADAHNDLARAEKHRVELDALIGELKRAVGLGGRDRPQGSGAEKARINVARSLRRAIAAVEAEVPALGAHLRVSVRTGHRCAYAPEPAAALTWDVTTD